MPNVSQMYLDQKFSNNVPIHGLVMGRKWLGENARKKMHHQAAMIKYVKPTIKWLNESQKIGYLQMEKAILPKWRLTL